MNELIEKRNIIKNLDSIEMKAEKLQALIRIAEELSNNSSEIKTLLDVINDYADQILEQTESLNSKLEEQFDEEYRKVISVA